MADNNILDIVITNFSKKFHINKKTAETLFRTYWKTIEKGLEEDGIVKVKGLGVFKIVEVSERESVDVNTGERILLRAHKKMSFTPEGAFVDLLDATSDAMVNTTDKTEGMGEEPAAPLSTASATGTSDDSEHTLTADPDNAGVSDDGESTGDMDDTAIDTSSASVPSEALQGDVAAQVATLLEQQETTRQMLKQLQQQTRANDTKNNRKNEQIQTLQGQLAKQYGEAMKEITRLNGILAKLQLEQSRRRMELDTLKAEQRDLRNKLSLARREIEEMRKKNPSETSATTATAAVSPMPVAAPSQPDKSQPTTAAGTAPAEVNTTPANGTIHGIDALIATPESLSEESGGQAPLVGARESQDGEALQATEQTPDSGQVETSELNAPSETADGTRVSDNSDNQQTDNMGKHDDDSDKLLEDLVDNGQNEDDEDIPEKKSWFRWWMLILLLLVFATGIAIVWLASKSAEDVPVRSVNKSGTTEDPNSHVDELDLKGGNDLLNEQFGGKKEQMETEAEQADKQEPAAEKPENNQQTAQKPAAEQAHSKQAQEKPADKPQEKKPAPQVNGQVPATHVYQGETFDEIAEHYYGVKKAGWRIVNANKGRIKNFNSIKPGTELILPPAEEMLK